MDGVIVTSLCIEDDEILFEHDRGIMKVAPGKYYRITPKRFFKLLVGTVKSLRSDDLPYKVTQELESDGFFGGPQSEVRSLPEYPP